MTGGHAVWIAPLLALGCLAQPPATPLWLRGYSVIPSPMKVTLDKDDVELNSAWHWNAGALPPNGIAVRTLVQDFAQFHSVELSPGSSGNLIRLAVRPDTVRGPADPELRRQAYRLQISPGGIDVTGNSDAGLFYGVQTLLQLARRSAGNLQVPAGVIEDWPALELRFLHWDTKHHQNRMETLKRYLDWSARFKVNMIGFELEDKFEYPSHPAIGAPGAYTTAELQMIVDYGLERFIQVVPIVQSPAHFGYVLKHPEFASLRADGNNYQSRMCDEETGKLIFSMYDDVIRATRGVNYFFVSTDEVYYAGIESGCARPYNPVNRSLAFAEFVRKAHDHLADQGRRMLAWLEYPLLPEHIQMIPSGVIDGVAGEPEFLPLEREKGMRQLIYVSMQGAEFLFPDHLGIDASLQDPPATGADDQLEFERGIATGRIHGASLQISSGAPWKANPIGVFGAAWDDSGLHDETFWLGWSAVAQYGWSRSGPSPEQHTAEFMRLYYGPRTTGMIEVYRTLQAEARAWQRSWDRIVSRVRGPGYGNSEGKGIGVTRYDQTLAPPPLPVPPDLAFQARFRTANARFLAQARRRSLENEELQHRLQEALGLADRNRYNLEVLLAITRFIGHHWRLLLALDDAETELARASAADQGKTAQRAVGHLLAAYNGVTEVQREGAECFRQLVAVFEKSQFPKGRSAGGRTFLQILDDTKDHWAGRTADLSFMQAPEDSIGLTPWRKDLLQLARTYADVHGVKVKELDTIRLEQ
jgi:hexosaminidase